MKKRAIEIVRNLTRTIDKIGAKVYNVHNLTREDMFANPTASKSKLEKKRSQIIEKYNLKQKEWK
jgi:Mg2+ and Co2+ transporter CorA